MKNEINNKQNKTSIVLFLSLALATVMLINAGIITANAGNNNFFPTPEMDNIIIEPLPTPPPRTNKRETTSDRTQAPKPSSDGSQRTTKSGNRQGNTSVAAPTEGSVPKPTGKNLSDRQQGNIKQLQSDLSDIKEGSQVTPEQKTDLKNSLMAMADGATKPNPATVQKFADDLGEALSDGRLSVAEQNQLAKDLEAVMNSANIPQAEIDKAIADAQAILLASGVDKSDVQKLGYDMQQIVTEAKKNIENATNKAGTYRQVPTNNAKEKPSSVAPSGAKRQKPQ